MSEPLDRFKALCIQAGITEQKPLHAVMLILFQTATMAQEAVKGGARGLSEQGEQELIFRVAENAASVTGQEVERLSRCVGWRNSFLMALAGLLLVAAGYLWGSWNRSGFLAQIEALNDTATIERICREHIFQRDGRTACNLPPVWIKGVAQ